MHLTENNQLMLDIVKCLYDVILRLEKATENENAIAAAVKG
jgi:hypothetical protein